MGRAYSSALQHAALALEEATTPRAVDAVLAAAGGGGAMALLHGVDYTGLLPTRLFAPPMLGSATVGIQTILEHGAENADLWSSRR